MASGRIEKNDIISPEALKAFSEIVAEFKRILAEAQNLKKSLKDSGFKAMGTDAKKLESILKRLGKAEEDLIQTKKKVTKANSDLSKSQKTLTKTTKDLDKTKKKLSTTTRSLIAVKKKLKDAGDRQSASNKKLRVSFSNLIKSAVSYAAAYFALNKVVTFFTRTLFNLNKRLDALSFSMRTVIYDSNELITTQNFLRKTAANYGQDILTLTERYTKFRAAAMQSNITATDTMKIFDSVAKAAAVMGLKTDEVNGVFLALEQMLSKGKVTTEELRRQLGERLPGAMGIMARAVGVSISELDKMMKKGEVLSAEALPKFADALEEAYGIGAVQKIDNLVAAQGRLSTSWKIFIEELNSSRVYGNVIEFFSDSMTKASIAFGDQNNIIEKFLLLSGDWGDAVREAVEFMDGMGVAAVNSAQAHERFNKIIADGGINAKFAAKLWEEYKRERIAASKVDSDAFDFSISENIDDEIKKLDQASKDFKSYSNLRKSALRDLFVAESAYVSDKIKTEESYLVTLSKSQRAQTIALSEAKNAYEQETKVLNIGLKLKDKTIDEAERRRLRKLQENRDTENEILLNNYEVSLALEIEIQNRLAEIRKKAGRKKIDEALDFLKQQQALELEQTKLNQANLVAAAAANGEDITQMEYDNGREIITQKTQDLKEQEELLGIYGKKAKDLSGEEKKERLRIDKEYFTLRTQLMTNAIDFLTKKEKDYTKELKEQTDIRLNAIYLEESWARLERAKTYNEDVLKSNKSKEEVKKASYEYLVKELSDANYFATKKRDLYEKGTKEYMRFEEERLNIERELKEKGVEWTEWAEEEKQKKIKATFDFAGEYVNKGIEISTQLNDNALQRAQNRYEREVQLAGDSESAKLSAKRKLEKEERKIAKRQAIANKAQAAFNIGLSTAQAIMGIWAEVPKFDFGISAGVLTGIVSALGLAQLGAVLGQPLPFFEKGGIVGDDPLIVAGEKGEELMITPSGKKMLTPGSATMIAGVPAGTEIIPHDETTRILANDAMKSTVEVVDMSQTNKYLSDIKKNTSESVTYEDGYKIVRRGNFTGKYRTR